MGYLEYKKGLINFKNKNKMKEYYNDLSGALAPHAAHFNMNILSSLTIFVSGLLHSWQITNFSMYSSILSLMRK